MALKFIQDPFTFSVRAPLNNNVVNYTIAQLKTFDGGAPISVVEVLPQKINGLNPFLLA